MKDIDLVNLKKSILSQPKTDMKNSVILSLIEQLEASQREVIMLNQGCENDPRIHEIVDLKERIAELEAELKRRDDQKPVAWRWRWSDDDEGYWRYTEEQRGTRGSVNAQPLYAAAPAVVLPPEIQRDDTDGYWLYKGGRVGGGAAEWYNKAIADAKELGCQPEKVVKRKIFTEFQICHYGTSEDYAKGYIDAQKNFTKDLEAAGVKWEGSK